MRLRPLLVVPVLVACAAEEAPDLRAPTVPAGDPAAPGPYAVGVTTLVLPEVEGQTDVAVEVWYPAAEAGPPTTYDLFSVPIPSAGARDVAPDPTAPSFLVAFSHGLGGVRQQNYTMAERLASFGFVVVSPDHPGTQTNDFFDHFGSLVEPLVRRPGTVVAAVDAVLGGAVEGLRPREDGYAMTGHSLGAFTAMFLGGGRIDIDAYTAACAAGEQADACGLIGAIEGAEAMLDEVHPPDDRIVTSVLQAPPGAFAFEVGSLDAVPDAFLQAGDKDGLVHQGGTVPAYDLMSSGTLAVYAGAGHNAPTDICDIALAATFSPDCGGAADGYADPDTVRELTVRHVVAWLGAHLGGEPSFEDLLGPGEGYTWASR